MNSNIILSATFLVLSAIIFTLFNSQNPFSPVPIPGSKNNLHAAKLLNVTGAVGPESLVFDSNGDGPYTGVADGRILKWEGEERGWTQFAVTSSNRSNCVHPFAPELEHVCGRPLGLKFDKKSGDLYIADAYLGLKVVGPAGGLATQVATEAEGQPFHFTNDMDISEDEDVIYFTDSSTVYRRRQFMLVLLSGDKTGRLMKYDKSTKEVKVLLSGLAFPNGVALSKDGSFLLVAETSTCKILRLWLRGPNAGQVDTFAVLPGFPDNVRRNSEGQFWVALHAKETPFAKWMSSNLWAGKALSKLGNFKWLHASLAMKPHAAAIKLSDEGEILEVLEDCEGKTLKFISEIEEKDGKLWMASVLMPYIGVYNL
ncbi:putative strictosidine synthase transcription factor WD40-like family [Medicago truncatula]|uniref:Putative strictosidine synthase transcription factor WD40-like family n=1 Tax=Medicago truncatula TaxID=3880 RepID=A0A072U1P3_MEDTR|nr:protein STRICTOSIDINE SYNTHASE-LIKE 10 [Medicago truncatula]KEH23602.1 strictosidine synthase family protein [Medicago truncatula]RHN47767.1 putative strictosidine synthase transcription factor WD40-like family [Medicago truncatula]